MATTTIRKGETAVDHNFDYQRMPIRRIQRIVFLEPSGKTNVYSMFPIPRLGCVNLGTVARQFGYGVRVYIEDIHPIEYNEVFQADLVGISIITPTANRGYEIADRVREKGIPIVIGGIHASFMKEEALDHADYVIRGEAEKTFVDFLGFLEGYDQNPKTRGLSFWKDGRFGGEQCHNDDAPLPLLDGIPPPNMELVAGWKKNLFFPVSTRRGCPYQCDFCTVRKFNGSKIRCHPLKYIEETLKKADLYKASRVFFSDDTFNMPADFTKEICKLAARIIPDIPKIGQFHWKVAQDDSLLAALKKANFTTFCVGIESPSDEVLKGMNKNGTRQEMIGAIRKIVFYGFYIHGMFIAGAKGDTVENIRAIPEFARSLGIASIQIMASTPLPGSDLFSRMQKNGKIRSENWEKFNGHFVVAAEADISSERLGQVILSAMLKFYSFSKMFRAFLRRDMRDFYITLIGRRVIRRWRKEK